jgi:repressor LexA
MKQAIYLTETQKAILEYLDEYTRDHGIAPTHREICSRFGYSSYGTVYKHLKLLQEKGFLRRDWNQKRGIELIRAIPGAAGSERELPYFGQIAAGRPIEAVTGNERFMVPAHLLDPKGGDHYVLRVVGESMVEEGIYDGDYVVVLRRERAQPGEMVVALIGDEATLKRYYPEGPMVRLQPANAAMKPIRVPAKDVRIQGIVVGLMRKF